MPVINPGTLRHWVDLDDPNPDTARTIIPSRVKVAIQPAQPGAFDEEKLTHIVQMRFHPQVTFNTRIRHTDSQGAVHELYVKGIQNIDYDDQWLRLLCEEVLPA